MVGDSAEVVNPSDFGILTPTLANLPEVRDLRLRPFFPFYGSKWRIAPRYPKPIYNVIVEPFAGSACYSLYYPHLQVILLEKDPVIAGVWKYLVGASPDKIRSLPPISEDQSVDDLDIEPAARSLIGFWLNRGGTRPCKTMSAWGRTGTHQNSFWGEVVRERIASQVEEITHWRVYRRSYEYAPRGPVTWFIDPPYAVSGKHYKFNFQGEDFGDLAAWCKRRIGQIIVCEQRGADWLPFRPFLTAKANESKHGGKKSHEVIWTN